MPNDYVTTKALLNELNTRFSGGKINRINTPSTDAVHLLVRAFGENGALIINAGAGNPRLYYTGKNPESSGETPSAFCMLLRKRLSGGIIESISTGFSDRIAVITVNAKNELYDSCRYRLLFEMTGGGSNVIITDGDYVIVDALRRVFSEDKRSLYPGIAYTPPPKNGKLTPEDGDALKVLDSLPNSEIKEKLPALLVGLSKETVAEIALMSENMLISDAVKYFNNVSIATDYSPSVVVKGERYSGISVRPYASLRDVGYIKFPSLIAAAECFYRESEIAGKKRSDTKELLTSINRAIKKAEKRYADDLKKLADSENSDFFKIRGELILCNIYKIKKGDREATLFNYYDNEDVIVPLDARLSPERNAAAYFKKYAKLKGAAAFAKGDALETAELINYLNSLKISVNNSEKPEEYAEIAAELSAVVKKSVKKQSKYGKTKIKKSSPAFYDIDGYKVVYGKNNLQNDEVTFNIASGGDLWLHAKGYHGAHVVIISNGRDVPQDVIAKAAKIAKHYSGAALSPKADVDYTLRKFVKKRGKPGLVTYTKEKTVTVTAGLPD